MYTIKNLKITHIHIWSKKGLCIIIDPVKHGFPVIIGVNSGGCKLWCHAFFLGKMVSWLLKRIKNNTYLSLSNITYFLLSSIYNKISYYKLHAKVK